MIRRVLSCLLPALFLAGGAPLVGAQKTWVTPLIPAPKWVLSGSQKVNLQKLKKYGCQVPVDTEYGAHFAEERIYENGPLAVRAFFEKAADPTSSYGLLTFYQSPAMHRPPGIQLARIGSKEALMARGRYFIRVIRPPNQDLSNADLRALLVAIGGARLSVENAQRLPTPLFGRGFVAGSEKYLLGPKAARRVLGAFPVYLIGFEDGVEAQVGTYIVGNHLLKFLLISYPTPQLAQVRYKAMQAALPIGGQRGSKPVYGKLSGSFVMLVLNSKSKPSADQLLSQFKLTEFVTKVPRYNPIGTEARQVELLIVGNIELVIGLSVFALFAGILLFFAKRLIIKVFPNSEFSREEGEKLIRLNLK